MSIENTVDFTNTWITGTPLQPDNIIFISGDKIKYSKISIGRVCGYVFGIGSITGILRMVSSIRALANEIFFDTKYLFGLEPVSRSRRFYVIGQNFVRGLVEALPGTGIPLFIRDVIVDMRRGTEALKQLKENDVGIIVNGELVFQMPIERIFVALKKYKTTLENKEKYLDFFSEVMLLVTHSEIFQKYQIPFVRRFRYAKVILENMAKKSCS